MQEAHAEFLAAGVRVVALSYDDPEILATFAKSQSINLPLLSDPNSAAIHALGIHNTDGVPHPGTFIVDAKGVIRAKLFEQGYKTRHSNQTLLELAATLRAGG